MIAPAAGGIPRQQAVYETMRTIREVLTALRGGGVTAQSADAVAAAMRSLTGMPTACLSGASGILAYVGPNPHASALETSLRSVAKKGHARLLSAADLGCEHPADCQGRVCAAAPVLTDNDGDRLVLAVLGTSADHALLSVVAEAAAVLAWGAAQGTAQHRYPASGSRVAVAPESPAEDPAGILPVDLPGRTRFIARDQVRWVEADGDYVRLHVDGGEAFLVRIPISRLERSWSAHGFVRIHRGYLVPFQHITEFGVTAGSPSVEVDGQRLPVSRRRAPELRSRLLRGHCLR